MGIPLQYPDFYGPNPRAGIDSTINNLISADSTSARMTILMNSIRPSPVDTSTFSPRMRLYRMFKEARNSIAHRGSIANEWLCAAYDDCSGAECSRSGYADSSAFYRSGSRSTSAFVMAWCNWVVRHAPSPGSRADHLLMCTITAERDHIERLRTDPNALPDPTQAGVVARGKYWAKAPNGPWIVTHSELQHGQNAVRSAVVRLLNIPGSQREDFSPLWPVLLAANAVEIPRIYAKSRRLAADNVRPLLAAVRSP